MVALKSLIELELGVKCFVELGTTTESPSERYEGTQLESCRCHRGGRKFEIFGTSGTR